MARNASLSSHLEKEIRVPEGKTGQNSGWGQAAFEREAPVFNTFLLKAGSVQAGVGEEWGRGRVISLPQSLLQQLILTSKMLWSPNIIPF